MISEKIRNLATEEYGVKIRNKKEVWWQRWLAKLLFFNPRYLEDYSNATFTEIHLTEGASWRTIAHELQHIVDMRKLLFVFFVLFYYSPQVLALAAFYNPAFLILLLPLPSIGRLWLEARGYGVSLAIRKWAGYSDKSIDRSREFYVKLLSNSSYYWAMPIKPITRWAVNRQYKRVLKRKDKLHQELYEIITNDRSS